MTKKVEILSPAGSYESLQAAILAGADAVYIGGSRFGARAFANNLEEDKLLEAIDYVHLYGKKIYLTINTLLKEYELEEELYQYLLPYYKHGIDAVIVQDIGVLTYIRKHFPDLPIHASTQMTITNCLGAKFIENLGVERIVTAREMNINEIREIREGTNVEIESFVHGALCYCYSGQCLYSSLIGGRSGNRGQCAQPCRLPYKMQGEKKDSYILSLKDMCTLEYIPELVEVGIDSFKIEGRMKKPEYVALVTAMYRKYVDLYLAKGKKGFSVAPEDREKLMDLYNRGGSYGGYYYTKNGRDMLSLQRPNHAGVPVLKVIKAEGKKVTARTIVDIHKGDIVEMPDMSENYTFSSGAKPNQTISFVTHQKQKIAKGHILNRTRNERLIREIQDTILNKKLKEHIDGTLILSLYKPAFLSVSYNDICIEIEGDIPEPAMNQPMDKERIEKQMRKTGNTPFEFEKLRIDVQGNLFIPMQSLNELRRQALDFLKTAILQKYRREIKESAVSENVQTESRNELNLSVYVETLEQFRVACEEPCVGRIYLDCNAIERIWSNKSLSSIVEEAHRENKKIYLALPHIFRKDTIEKYEKNYENILKVDWDGVLIRNYESFQFLKNHSYKKNIVTDYNLYQFNRSAKQFWMAQGVESITAPLELNFKELQDIGIQNNELIVYGYLPMMVSAQCIKNTISGCQKEKGCIHIKDRYNKLFAVKNHCDYCYNIIYNTLPLVLTDQREEILTLSPKSLRLHFTVENQKTMREILRLYDNVFLKGCVRSAPDIEFTRGHFKRGVK